VRPAEPSRETIAKAARLQTPKPRPTNGDAIFDPKIFLAKVGEGRTIAEYSKDQMVFSQGDPANAVFYIQKGKVKLTVVSDKGKEAKGDKKKPVATVRQLPLGLVGLQAVELLEGTEERWWLGAAHWGAKSLWKARWS
jgi:CRP-like cAMP-binding protein